MSDELTKDKRNTQGYTHTHTLDKTQLEWAAKRTNHKNKTQLGWKHMDWLTVGDNQGVGGNNTRLG